MIDPPRIWVCLACGRHAGALNEFRDAACVLAAAECLPDSIEYDEHGRVMFALAAASAPPPEDHP